MKTVSVLGFRVVPLCLLLSACATLNGPAYDSAQDNPKNALPESIVLFKIPTGSDESSGEAGARAGAGESSVDNPLQSSGEYQDFLYYQQWQKAKESNNADYQEFLEFRQWLLFKKQQSTEGS